jgi:hypothetical protein
MFRVELNREILVRKRPNGQVITVEYRLGRETDKALELREIWRGYGEADGEESVWIPKSAIKVRCDDHIVVDAWVAKEKDLRGEWV